MQMTADKIDISRSSGDALAHGNVKATWIDPGKPGTGSSSRSTGKPNGLTLGGNGPAHVIAAEALLEHATGLATFRGAARLWQQADSISAPVIVLDRARQTLAAHTASAADPVRAVLVSAETNGRQKARSSSQPAVIRMRGGDFEYSEAERKATMHSGAVGSVTAETGSATSISNEVEVILFAVGNHAGKDGSEAQVDRMIATGHVIVNSAGRRGTGEQLVYSGESGEYLLTGTVAAPPRFSDPQRGTVSGEALIFHSQDDSVTVEGGAGKTTTQSRAPR
jgi:lipopolysaccharide export system protein LptA